MEQNGIFRYKAVLTAFLRNADGPGRTRFRVMSRLDESHVRVMIL